LNEFVLADRLVCSKKAILYLGPESLKDRTKGWESFSRSVYPVLLSYLESLSRGPPDIVLMIALIIVYEEVEHVSLKWIDANSKEFL